MKVHRIQGIAFSSYLIETPDALFLVDSGFRWFEQLILHKVRSIGRDPAELDARRSHASAHRSRRVRARAARPHRVRDCGASRLARGSRRGGRVYSPPTQLWTRAVQWLANNALPLLRLPSITPSVVPADGERLDRFGLPGALYYTPGHSEWCVSLLLDDGTAFAGDLIIGAGHMTSVVSPPAMAADPVGAIDSMKKLLNAGAKRFMPAHGRAFTANDVRDMLARLGACEGR